MTTPVVTVAIATYERPEGLRRVLRALGAQTLPRDRFEVVVVDDASTDDTPSVLAAESERSGLHLRTVRLEVNGGPAVARNAAWRLGSAPVVAFTDDDCAPQPTWLEEGIRAIDVRPDVVVGATQPDPAQRHLLGPMSRTLEVSRATFAPTCNVFYLRTDLEAVGGFDEGFRGGEDTDLAWRVAQERGRELRFVPEALVWHDVRRRSVREAVDDARRWSAIPAIVARHPARARAAWGRWMRVSHPRALLAAAGLLLTPVLPVALALTLPWLRLRVFNRRPSRAWITNARWAPALLAVDLVEIWVLLRASITHRALIL